jgi:DNA-binding response OmpR family regulator
MTKILLVEDDKNIIENLVRFLQSEGFSVSFATGQTEALSRLSEDNFDLALLDVSLPDGNGFTLCSEIKRNFSLPVIFLTASGDELSTLTGFELGADDYIAKPFRPRELVTRIRNILRLTRGAGSVVKINNVTVDTVKGTVTKSGREVFLTALEYRLLLMLLNNRGISLTRTQLLESIWDIGGDFVNDNTLTVYIKRLREKLEDDPQNPTVIKTVRGIGYKVD